MKKYVEEYKDYVRDWRRYFHAHPELSFEEFETTKTVAKELENLGIPYEINEKTGTGLIGIIDSGKPGKTVALRADMDALNVTEKNNVEYKSKTDGKMHACGHDGHTAMLLGAAKMLMNEKDHFTGKVVLIFQPAEEVGKGAKAMIDYGDWFKDVDNVFGTHVWSGLDVGKVSVEAGERMAAADRFTLKVIGKSGHGSQPHETVDAVVVASSIVINLQTLVARTYSPLESVAITVGSFHSGTRFNIIAGDAILEGTCRYFSQDVAKTIEENILRVAENTAAALGATVELDYEYILGPTTNEEKSSAIAEEAVRKVMGEDAVQQMQKTTGGEDFSFYLAEKPGCFAFIGVKNDAIEANYPHHSERFNMDDSVLSKGAAVYAQYAMDYLNQN